MAEVIKIRTRGRIAKDEAKAEPKPARKRASTRKPASKRRSTKPASTAAKRGPGRPRKNPETEQATPATAPVRRPSKGVDPRTEAKLIKLVQKMGERRAKAEAEHQEAINALHQAAQEAMSEGVSMAKVADASGISRQWLYKMGEFRGRGNGGNGKSVSQSTAKPAPKQRTTARKSTTTRQAQATGGSRRRISIRSAA